MASNIPSFLLSNEPSAQPSPIHKKARLSFLDRTIHRSAKTVTSIYAQAEQAEKTGFIYRIHPHIKVISLVYLVVMISFTNQVFGQLMATAAIFMLYLLAGLNIVSMYRKILALAFLFGFLVAAPAALNVITPGDITIPLLSFEKSYRFWIYHIPQHIGFTHEGMIVVARLFLRVLNSVSIAFLIVFTTSFPLLVKSFKVLGVPDTFMMIITLAYKFIFILSKTIEETYLAFKSRLFSHIKDGNIRKLIAGRIFFIFNRSRRNYEYTYMAMLSRGYHGKVKLYTQSKLAAKDFVVLGIVVILGIALILI